MLSGLDGCSFRQVDIVEGGIIVCLMSQLHSKRRGGESLLIIITQRGLSGIFVGKRSVKV